MYEMSDVRMEPKTSAKIILNSVECEAPVRGIRVAIDDLITTADQCVFRLRDIERFFVGEPTEKSDMVRKEVHDSDLTNSFSCFKEELYGTLSIAEAGVAISDRILDALLLRDECNEEPSGCGDLPESSTITNSPIETAYGAIEYTAVMLIKNVNRIFTTLFGEDDEHIINVLNENLPMERPLLNALNNLFDVFQAISALLNEIQKRL